MALPLSGIKVLDFTHLLPGELCSAMLADLGCAITRVETLHPRLAQQLPPIVKGESLYYWSLHRNKQRIGLDLKKPEAVKIVHQLAESVDVVIENFRPGVMSRLGIGYDDLSRVNEKIVYCSISGYGQTSEYSQRPGHDLNFIAESGVLGLSTQEDGRPAMPGILIADYTSAGYAGVSIVSALFEREKTGKGRHLDIGMFHSTLSTVNVLATALLYTGEHPEHVRPAYRGDLANYNVYRCKDDRYIAVAPLEPQFWQIFCDRIGRMDLIPKWPAGPNKEMRLILEKVFVEKTLAEWTQIFEGSNCCVSPVSTLAEAVASKPAVERNMVVHMEHPLLGQVSQLRTPIPFADQPGGDPATAPDAAAVTTFEVLRQLGYDADQIEKLASAGVIAALEQGD